jgi:polyvinyl alcohol dehydrogenase (cytochrome)
LTLRRSICALAAMGLLTAAAAFVHGESHGTERGKALFEARCASCHLPSDAVEALDAPPMHALRQMGWVQVRFALTRGSMRPHAQDLDRHAVDRLVAYVTGEDERAQAHLPANAFCSGAERDQVDIDDVLVGQWGLDARNTRFQDATRTAVNASNAGALELKWAFGVPRTAMMRSMPVVTADTLYLATLRGELYALSKRSGCIKWIRDLGTPLRTALHMGVQPDSGRPVLYVGDMGAAVNALDAQTGERLWRTSLQLTPWSMLTGSQVQHGDQLIVPVSSYEVSVARNDAHECCRSRGAVVSLDAATGEIQWQTFMTPEAERTFVSEAGTQQWGPSGASVWSTPTIDAARGVVYVGTGQNNSWPSTDLSDSIVALDLDSGAIRWSFQGTQRDTYNDACVMRPAGGNCPPEAGPDFDFGASAILASDGRGKAILLAGQKSGEVFALDPDAQGEVLWSRRLSLGTWLGGIHFGMALEGLRLFVPINDPEYPIPGYEPRPGIYALSVDDGRLLWQQRISRGCEITRREAAASGTPWPECSFFYGYSPAVTAAPGAVFASGTDGAVRAYATSDGELLWEVHTARPFDTINGVAAHGGAVANPGVQLAGRMLFVQSGYSLHGLMPGNVLLAYELPESPAHAAANERHRCITEQEEP